MREVILATQNKDKIKEIEKILGQRFKVKRPKKYPNIVEDRKTFEENAIKKAEAIFKLTGILTLADDSGLEVKALGGKPGVRSSRFAWKGCTYADNNKKLLKLLRDIPYKKRKARFVTVVAIAFPSGKIKTVEGTVSGFITKKPKGEYGFGYDPLFYYPKLKKTFAELKTEEKNKVSHRARAFNKAKKILIEYFRKN